MHLSNPKSIQQHYDHVYVSPHLDDVAASCGGGILKQIHAGQSVLVVSVFTKNPENRDQSGSTALKNILDFGTRRREDHEAMHRLKADCLWLDYTDIIFRLKKPIKRYRPLWPADHQNEVLRQRLLTDLSLVCDRSNCHTLSLPLGIGQHVDHQIVYRAGVALRRSRPRDLDIRLYEDYPYVFFPFLFNYRLKLTGITYSRNTAGDALNTGTSLLGDTRFAFDIISAIPSLQLGRRALKPALFATLLLLHLLAGSLMKACKGELGEMGVEPVVTDISDTIEEKMHAVRAYASQLSPPFTNRARVEAVMLAYARLIDGSPGRYLERCWQLLPPAGHNNI